MLLVGMGGSGRRSLTRLSSFLANTSFFQLEANKKYGLKDFRADLFKKMFEAGTTKQSIVFLINEQAIMEERFLEDLNHLITSGEISGLIGRDELDDITVALNSELRLYKNMSVLELFNLKMRNQLHVVISLSPVGEKLRYYLRK